MAFSYNIKGAWIRLQEHTMDYELKKIILIMAGVILVGGLSGLFNMLYGVVVVSLLIGYIAVTLFWKDILLEILIFISSFFFPRRWQF